MYVKCNSGTFGKLAKAGATAPLWGSLPAGRLGWQRLLTPRLPAQVRMEIQPGLSGGQPASQLWGKYQ